MMFCVCQYTAHCMDLTLLALNNVYTNVLSCNIKKYENTVKISYWYNILGSDISACTKNITEILLREMLVT